AWVALDGGDPTAAAATTDDPGSTATVRRGDLTESSSTSGTLEYAGDRSLLAAGAGTVTWLPASGRVVHEGQALYRIDTLPVVRLDGSVPAWRELGPGIDDGADVEQLEEALLRLGYGSDVGMEADGEWTWTTTHAVEEWQEDNDLDETGRLPLGSVVFTAGDVRVSGHLVERGDRVQPGTALLDVSGVGRQVALSLSTTQRNLVPVGGAVELSFPDGTTARGRIVDVELVPAPDEQSEDTLAVTIEPDGRRARRALSGQLDGASVVVTSTDVVAEDVLLVPVTALVATAEGGYGLEVVDDGRTRIVPVETGGFADTAVAVSGDIAEGDQVVIP
ncbi:MAG TPA: efflux RND transporter periplasmic adaptor subunit, partial [Nocardioides sp.]|nr:efflux RND transporter periplasmic adaptor subunit [Nocardioides sp.]